MNDIKELETSAEEEIEGDNEEDQDSEDEDDTEVEPEDTVVYPAIINTERCTPSVFELKRRYEFQALEMQPEYQRSAQCWDRIRKSELIESVLMGLPLPLFYLFETKSGAWQIIDGLQRLTAFFEFMNGEYRLSKKLKMLPEIGNKYFSELEGKLQRRLEDYPVPVNLIKYPTPDRIKFDIFERVNRGGQLLNRQEMRNAMYQGQATKLLNELAQNEDFKIVTEGISPKRMKDRYIIIRFIAFSLYCSETIDYRGSIDDFLGECMQYLNKQDENGFVLGDIKLKFKKSMKNSLELFGVGCFRRSFYSKTPKAKKLPLNMALFESLAYLCSHDIVLQHKKQVKTMVQDLFIMNSQDENIHDFSIRFIDTITVPALDSSKKVQQRFRFMNNIIKEISH